MRKVEPIQRSAATGCASRPALVRHRGLLFLMVLAVPALCHAEWAYRRSIQANWDVSHAPATSIGIADIFTAGHAAADGSDIRVTAGDGSFVPCKVLMMGPGDRARVAFRLIRPISQYVVYFGSPAPDPPANLSPLVFDCGLLMQTRLLLAQGEFGDLDRLRNAWLTAGPELGQTLIPAAEIGFNPFGPQDRYVSKITGKIDAPETGRYVFSAWANQAVAAVVDGNFAIYARVGPHDARNQHAVELQRGPHTIEIYHVCNGGDGIFLIAWKSPHSALFDTISRNDIAAFHTTTSGEMQKNHSPLTADFSAAYQAESFFDNGYSHHYRFDAFAPSQQPAQYQWDFGDGQTASGQSVDHVFLAPGIYPVKLTVAAGGAADTQTTRLAVDRLWEQIDHPPGESAEAQAKLIADENFDSLPQRELCRAVALLNDVGSLDPLVRAASKLASLPTQAEGSHTAFVLNAATKTLVAAGRAQDAVRFWQQVPSSSPIHSRAATSLAELYLWQVGDFESAVKMLKPLANLGDPRLKRSYGQALILDQQADAGEKLLASIPPGENPEHHVALAGALARSIEFYVTEKDADAGLAEWERWQGAFPDDFVQGYGVLLRTELMEIQGNTAAAAKVAKAFATAEPNSSYAPQLLDRAAKLLLNSDPAQSAEIRKLLKQRYPEDPLSQ